MAHINKSILLGRIGTDPEIFTGPQNIKHMKFDLATTETWKDNERTDWHKIVIFRERLVEYIEKSIKKGDLVYIEGKIRYDKFEDDQKIMRKTTSIVIDKVHGELKLILRSNKNVVINNNDLSTPAGELDDIPDF